MLYAVLDLVAAVLSLLGALLCLTAAVGLVRFPDLVSRMHPAAKPQSLGMLILLVGLALHIRTVSAALFLALVTLLQMMTVTLSSHVVARTGYRTGLVDPSTLVADELADAIASRRRSDDRPPTGARGRAASDGADAHPAAAEHPPAQPDS